MPVILTHAEQNDGTIRQELGRSEYSYYFVLKAFRAVLESLGPVVRIEERVESGSDGHEHRFDPIDQAEAVHAICQRLGEPCVLLSFTPPHRTPTGVRAPTIPVFAWEFPNVPCESWEDEPRHDWRVVLREYGAAVTHSTLAAEAVRRAMGPAFPVAAIPAPVWDRFAVRDGAADDAPDLGERIVELGGKVLDENPRAVGDAIRGRAGVTLDLDLSSDGDAIDDEPPPARPLVLDGVVYTAVLNPIDGRKNWRDLVRAFCLALADHDDATLVLRLVGRTDLAHAQIGAELRLLRPFRCRVVATDGFLTDAQYLRLAHASTFAVNASRGEGQCLPLMEYMSAGKPAVAPCHTGMADYLDATNAFLVDSSLEPASWPQDTRHLYRTFWHRLNAASLLDAFRESYAVARRQPERYRAMARSATERLRRHCSEDVVREALRRFLADRLGGSRARDGRAAGADRACRGAVPRRSRTTTRRAPG